MHVCEHTPLLNCCTYGETEVVGHDHPMLHVVLRARHFRCEAVLFSHMIAIPFSGIPFLNKVAKTMFEHNACALLYMYCKLITLTNTVKPH
jgi:hypothetical protein